MAPRYRICRIPGNHRIHRIAEVQKHAGNWGGSWELQNSRTHWNGCIPWHCAIPKQSSSIQGVLGQGALTAQRAGVGQQVKPTRCRAGGGWVRGNAYSHKATSQTNLDESPEHLAQPLSTGGHTTLPPCGVPPNFVQHITIPLTSESSWQL